MPRSEVCDYEIFEDFAYLPVSDTLAEHPISEQGRSIASGLVPDASELSKSLQRTDDHIESCARKIVAKRRQKTNGHSQCSIQGKPVTYSFYTTWAYSSRLEASRASSD